MVVSMKCIMCGQENNDKNIYCLNCGNKLKEDKTQYNKVDYQYNDTYDRKSLVKIGIVFVIALISFILLASTITSDIVLFNNTTNTTQYNTTNNSQYNNINYSQYYSQNNNTTLIYLGNSNSYKFHYPNCKSAQQISPEHLVTFNSRDDAISQGYHPCGLCNP